MIDIDSLTRDELVELVSRQQAEIARLGGDAEESPAEELASPAAWRALAAAAVAITAASIAELVLRSRPNPLPAIALYVLAIVVLAATFPPFVLKRPRVPSPRRERTVRGVLGVGALVASGFAAATFLLLSEQLAHPAGLWLWLSSMFALLLTGIVVWRKETPTPRWASGAPASRRGRLWLTAGVVVILAAAVVARVLWIDRIPLGINPDEGDRAATAMQILRGTTDRSLFDSGWYRISMMYFYLLAGALKALGIGFVQARLFTALFGVLTVAGILWIAVRQFSVRVGLFAGAILALTGLALQFSRVTSEAGQTAFLWVLSMGLLLEGARSGRSLPWIGAGLAGGYSLYFYPTGRMWPVLAALVGVYLLIRWRAAKQGGMEPLVRGLALAALASLVVSAPFFAQYYLYPHEFALRFQETSVLRPEGAARLPYLEPSWSQGRILLEQLGRMLGVFSRYPDGSGFWPMFKPVLDPVLALLALLGLGVSLLRWRDPRVFTLGLWFCVGATGVVVTVETPNVLRLATAAPVLALFAALVLDELVRRVAAISVDPRRSSRLSVAATACVALLITGALVEEARFYFGEYAGMRLWTGWNQEGRALTTLPPGTLSTSLGSSFHMINSGWVRLLAPDATRGGIKAPGSMLPLAEDGSRGFSFSIYPEQAAYLPWLTTLYPSARAIDYTQPGESLYFMLLDVSAEDVAASRGATLTYSGESQRVDQLGQPPEPAPSPPQPARWTSTVRVPQQWNYSLHVGPGPARLFVDGQLVLDVPEGQPAASTELNLARGDHGIVLEGTTEGTEFLWARMTPGQEPVHVVPTRADLRVSDGVAHGLAGTLAIEGLPLQTRQDNTLANCCLGDVLDTRNRPVQIRWLGTLDAPEEADYSFRLTAPGTAVLSLDGAPALRVDDPNGGTVEARLPLVSGAHDFELVVESAQGANGALELAWSRPNAPLSIIPESFFTPPAGSLVMPPLADDVLLTPDVFPADKPLEVVE